MVTLLLYLPVLLASGPAESTITDFILPNGMRWIVCRTEHHGDAALLLYIDAGGAQETSGRTGLVSTLAAMWRLDTPALEKEGARRPQVVSNLDRIIFRSTWSPQNVEPWFRAHAALLHSSSLARFSEGQAAAIATRDKMRQGGGSLLDDFVAAAYIVHPYRHPAYGFASEIDQLTPPDAAEFVTRYFVPSNAIAVAAGDVQPAVIRALAEKYFAPLPKVPVPERLRAIEPPQRLERRLIAYGSSRPALVIGFHNSSISAPDAPIYGILRTLMSRRLKARLLEKEKLVSRIDTMPYPAMKYPFLTMVLCFVPPVNDTAAVEGIIHEELSRLAAEPVPPEEFAPLIRSGADELAKYAPFELATELADWHAMSGTWRSMFRYPEIKSKVTPADVQALAKRLFVPNERTTAITFGAPPASWSK
ncbi:MAG: insulinase family protein [Bryobacterales bacterium]|nr:insulinase family protein [Bryobacterales bacterium]